MTFPQQPQQPQYPQYPQGPAPQYPQSQFPQQPLQYSQQFPQPNRNPFFEWLQRAKRDFSRIGASLCLMVIIWYAGVFLLKGVVRAVAGGVGAGGDMPNWMTFLISDVPLYLIAMPVAVVLMGKSTVIETRKFNMKPGMFFKLLLMCLPMMWVGSMVGSMLSLALSDGEATNRVADLAMQTNIWNVVFLVILGPIFEEWMFRKQLIDHTRKYGEKTAILLSGLAFGLFHMNLFQFFYAFLLGVMFGYIYMRTSKLRYSTAMHMIINFNGGVLAPWILTRVDLDQLDKVSQAAENGNVAAMEQWASQNATGLAIMLVYFLLYGAVILAGFVLLIRNFRKAEFYIAPEELPRGVRRQNRVRQRRHDHVHRAHGAADGDQSVPIAAVARIMKAGRGTFPVGLSVACIACVACVALRTPLPLFAAADRAMLKIIGMRDRLRHRIRHRGQQQIAFRKRVNRAVNAIRGEPVELHHRLVLRVGKPHGRLLHGADDVGLHTLHIHARLRGERHRHQALVRRIELFQRGGVQNGIRNDHLVAVALAHDGLTPIDVLDGAGDACHLDVVARLNDAAKHKPEASDHIGDRIFQTQRHRKTSDAECGEQGGRVDSKHRLQQRADGECPYHHTQDVDEDGGVRHL